MTSTVIAGSMSEYPELLSPADTARSDWDRLARYLGDHGMHVDPAQPIRQFAGGLANRNYLLIVDGAPTVLRRPPDGDLPPGAHDMAREHRILSRLADALPFIARGLHYCGDRSVIGVPFQLIEYRAGLVIRGRICRRWRSERMRPNFSPK